LLPPIKTRFDDFDEEDARLYDTLFGGSLERDRQAAIERAAYYEKLNSPAQQEAPQEDSYFQRSAGELAGDIGSGLAKGVNSVGGALVQTADAAVRYADRLNPVSQLAAKYAPELTAKSNAAYDDAQASAEGLFKNNQDYWQGKKSESIQGDAAYIGQGEGFVDTLSRVAERPQALPDLVADSAAFMVPGAWAARALNAFKVGAAGITTGSMATGAVLDAGATGVQAKQEVMSMTLEQLMESSPDYQGMVESGINPDDAKLELARNAGFTAQAIQLPISFLASKLTGAGKLESDFFTGKGAKGFFSTIAKEMGEEAVQESSAQMAQNTGVNLYADNNKSITDGVGNSAALGMAAGGAQGAGVKSIGMITGRNSPQVDDGGLDRPTNGERVGGGLLDDMQREQLQPEAPAVVHTGNPDNPDDRFKFELDQNSFVSGLRARIDARKAQEAAKAQELQPVTASNPYFDNPDQSFADAARSFGEQNGLIQKPIAYDGGVNFERSSIPAPESSGLSLAPLEQPDNGIEFTAPEKPLRTNDLAVGVEKAISQNIDRARNARMPENLKDVRLLRNRYRKHLESVATSLDSSPDATSKPDSLLDFATKNGGLNTAAWAQEGVDPADAKIANKGFAKTFRNEGGLTPDDLAELASQNGYRGFTDDSGAPVSGAALSAVLDEIGGTKKHYSSEQGGALQAAQSAPSFVADLKEFGSPDIIKRAITKALAGEKLGSNQAAIVQEVLDNANRHTRDESGIRNKWETRAKGMLANRANKAIEQWRNRDEHAQDATGPEAALNEIMDDAVVQLGIDPDTVKSAYDKYAARYPDSIGKQTYAMKAWVSANQPNTQEHLNDGQKTSVSRDRDNGRNDKGLPVQGSSGERGATESGVRLPPSSEAGQGGREARAVAQSPQAESGSDSAGRDAGLRQPVSDLPEGWDKSLLKARRIAKADGVADYNKLKLADLVPMIRAKHQKLKADHVAGNRNMVDPIKAGPSNNQEPIKSAGPANTEPAADSPPSDQEPVKQPSSKEPQPSAGVSAFEGRNIDGDWIEFAKDSGSLNIPRAEMPQIKAEHRGAMVNFLNARGIDHEEQLVPADELKPTQKEFSRSKVAKAKNFEGGSRSILVSSDDHVLDGHHQWLASLDKGEEVRVIRLDAPIKKLLDAAHEFPSSTTEEAQITTKGTKLADKATETIADFGEKLEGAKKDTRSLREKLSDKEIDTAAVPLSKSFPQPDYEKLAAAGVPQDILAFVAQIRGEIKNKPKRGVKSWSDTVNAMRSFANDLLEGRIALDSLIKEMRPRGSYMRHMADVVAIANEILPSQIKDLGSFKLEDQHYSVYRGEKNVDKWVVTNTGGKQGEFRTSRGQETHFDTKEESLAFIKSQVSTSDASGKPIVKFDIWSVRGQEGVWVGKKLGTRKYIELKKFDAVREAKDYIATNNNDLVELLKHKKQIGSERRAEQNERVGKDYRRGSNVTQDLFNETFGFRGVQFGNYVENDRRQQDLNNAYDGLLDLADVLGIPPKAISLNGELGLAFGARGSGGKDAASAHYESQKVVINLTKSNGAGSLAHEWWHALDNYFAKMGGLESKSGEFLTELDRPKRKQIMRDGRTTVVALDPAELGVRPEVYDAFKGVVNTIKNETKLYQRSAVLDGRKTADYWTTTRELTARAFERFVIDELAAKGYESDYLASILPKDAWDASESFFGNTSESYPYPTDEEAATTNAAYSKLFDAIESKETESGTALYSLTNDEKAPEGVSKQVAQAVIDAIRKDWKNTLIKIEAVANVSEMPAAVRERIEQDKLLNEKVKAVFHGGAVYINASALKDSAAVEAAVFHEVYGHYGLRALFGQDTSRATARLFVAMGGNKGLHDIAKKHGVDLSKYEKLLASKPADTRAEILTDELLAHIAQDSRPSVKRWFQELIGAVRTWLRANGFKSLGVMDDNEIMHLLKQSREAARDLNLDGGATAKVLLSDEEIPTEELQAAYALSDAPAKTKELIGDDPLLSAWGAIAKADGVFQLPVSDKTDFVGIAQELEGDRGFQSYEADEMAEMNKHGAKKAWRIVTPNGSKAAVYENGDKVWIDVSDLETGEDGKRIYNMVASYAYNNDKVFIGDPGGLSVTAKSRRLENMISSALKFGTTRHLQPHKLQLNDGFGVPGLKWRKGDDAGNLKNMIMASYESVKKQFPKIENLAYNQSKDIFEDSTNGNEFTRQDFRELAQEARGVRDAGAGGASPSAGRTTLERAVLTHTILRGTSGQISELLGRLSGVGSERLAGNNAILYSLANNSKTRSQGGFSASDQTETAAFKKWFGDSKVVDAQGKPLVVYHGTRRDFSEFEITNPHGAAGNPKGAYFTADRSVAKQYAENDDGEHDGKSRIIAAYLHIENDGDGKIIDSAYRGREYVVFDPANIKSAIGNNGSFDPSNPDIRYSLESDGDPETRRSGGFSVSGLQENPIVFGIGIDSILRVWQDKMRPLLRTQEAIKSSGGKIAEAENSYLAEEAFHGKTENDLRKMRERYLEPMARKMAAYDIERDELDMYLWAKHAQERNAQIAKINPDMPDGGSGMTNAQAEQIIQQAEKDGKKQQLEDLASIVYLLLDEKRQIMRHSLADDSMVDTWNNAYKYYVPLKGRAVDDSGGSYPRVGRGFDIRGKESLRALGRRTKPESPTLHAIKDTTESIIRYRKNEVGNAFLALVEANPNPEYWEVHDASSPDFERKLLKKNGNEVVGTAKVINKEDYFITKRDGKEYYIRIEDPLLMRAMKNLGPEKMNWIVRQLAKVSRFLSSMVTSYNPEFVVTNFSRDIQTAILNLQAEIDLHDGKARGKKITGNMLKGVPMAAKAVYASLGNKRLTGELAEWQKSFDDFRNDGANTGWFQLLDIEQQASELTDLMEMNKATVKGTFLKNRKRIGDFVGNINSSVENAIRLSVYKSAVDSGITRKQAASLAKNLTVNFNRKGEVGASMNALYMFFNASVQGTAAFARAMGTLKIDENGKRKLNVAQKAAIGIMIASYGLALINRGFAGEDDDGENWWDKVPDYVKERNFVLMKSIWGGKKGEYITIPLPYGYNIFNALATSADSAVSSKKGIGEAAGSVVKAMMGAFSPLGVAESNSFAGSVTRTIAPTAIKPLADMAANENFFGSSIFAENFEFGTPKPQSHLHLRSTNDFWVWTSEFLNDVTGGSAYRSGLVDVSPDKMGYVFNYFVGGAGQFYSRIAHIGIKKAQDREIEPTDIPFLRRFTGEVKWYKDQQTFYERKDEIDQAAAEYKSMPYGSKERAAFAEKHKALLSLYGDAKKRAAKLADLRKLRNRVTDSESISEREKEIKLKPIELRMRIVISGFNREYGKGKD